MRFTGFGADAIGFWEGLAADNTKAYWHAHKDTYDTAIAEPLAALCEALEPEFGVLHRYRPQRDVRFSADKRPYQEFCSASGTSTRAGSGVLYLQLSFDGLMLAGGVYQPSTATLGVFRTAVDQPRIAASFDDTLTSLRDDGFDLDGDPLKTAPRGWPKDHPRIDLLRLRNLALHRTHALGPWLHTPECLDVITTDFRQLEDWNTWLARTLGPLPG